MNRKKINYCAYLLIAVGVGFAAPNAYSQEAVDFRSPGEIVRFALDNHPLLKADAFRIESSAAAEGGYSILGTTSATFTREGMGEGLDFNEQKFEISQIIHWPGSVGAQRTLAESRTDLSRADAAFTRRQVISRAKSAYLYLLVSMQTESVLNKQKEMLVRMVDVAQRRLELGEIAEWDVTKTRIELQNAEMDWERAAKDVLVGRTLLSEASGLKDPSNWTVTDSLVYRGVDPDFDELEHMIRSNPVITQVVAEAEIRQRAADAISRSAFPDLFVAYMRQDFGSGFNANGVVVGAQFALNGSARRSLERAEKLNYQAALWDVETTRASVEAAFDAAKSTFEAAGSSLDRFLSDQVPDVDRILGYAERAYTVGDLTLVEVFDVRRSLLQHQMSGIRLLSSYYEAVLDIENLTGAVLWE